MNKQRVENMAEVRALNDDNDGEQASERVWSALSLAISVIDQMRPYVLAVRDGRTQVLLLRCSAEQLLKEID